MISHRFLRLCYQKERECTQKLILKFSEHVHILPAYNTFYAVYEGPVNLSFRQD